MDTERADAAEHAPRTSDQACSRFAVFSDCPFCGEAMAPEHAHYRCTACGWRDSCCD